MTYNVLKAVLQLNKQVRIGTENGMDVRAARERTGLSEKTLRRLIKDGSLTAIMVGSGPNRHWEVSDEALSALSELGYEVRNHEAEELSPGKDGHWAEKDVLCKNCHWLQEYLEEQFSIKDAQLAEKDGQIRELLASKDGQLTEKDGQIRELHVLLQRAQEQLSQVLPALPPPKRAWWRIWERD